MDEMDCQVVMVSQAGMAFLGLLEWQERRENGDDLDLKVKVMFSSN